MPTTVESFADFQRQFGGPEFDYPLPDSVRDFFANGGSRATIVRVWSSDNGDGIARIQECGPGSIGLALQATSPGSWGNSVRVHIVLPADSAELFDLFVLDEATGENETYRRLSVANVDQTLMASSLVRVQTRADGTSQLPTVRPPATLESPDPSMPWPKLSGGFDSALPEPEQ